MNEEFDNINEQAANNEETPAQKSEQPIAQEAEQPTAEAFDNGVEQEQPDENGEEPKPDVAPNTDTPFMPNQNQQYSNPRQTPFAQAQNGYQTGCYQPINQPMNQSINQPINQGVYMPMNQGAYMPCNQPYTANTPNIPNVPPAPAAAPQNPYAQPVQNMPAQPQYGTVNFARPPKENRSFPAGLIIFLVTAVVVLTLCICLTVVAVSKSPSSADGFADKIFDYNYQQPTSNDDNDTQKPTESSNDDALDKNEVVDTTDENGPQITLKKQPKDIFEAEKYNAKYAYDKAKTSVVGVIGYTDKDKDTIGSQGTGIIISENGYIVTNSHVIGDSKTKYRVVVMIAGQEYEAQVTGYDSRTDIAVLKIEKTGLTAADFADSAEVSVGQEVVAIGNPGGINFSNSLTQGIVSALDRDVSHGNVSYIQTDAAINPGNSGGPLLNMSGQVIGITTVKIVNTSYEGMGFAIPSQQAVSIIDSIIKQGYVEGRVRIGLTGNEINSAYSSYYNMPVGIYVVTVDENGPLAGSDIQPGDIITKIDDVDITSFSVLYKELDKHKPGDVVTLTYKHPNESETDYTEEHTLEVTLAADSSAQ
ncbi:MULTISPECIES: S1C family serine protease [unclassified Ruminococcus]|uniref:S1C family serine protease n=1 Tax=unclassified Ruminococcus TaxID=2608920 RepID=UPI00210B4B74|nr:MULTISPECIES: trypsin-like peptidase domain-containing protein [unclassified Ruminococcus]MCQ4023011.1 trypsin-like serine protease [Ruminococcus sp. zg-924]MCQ4115448.1 trypsin-like serine protease [Ruminococcus sp. zg-921]